MNQAPEQEVRRRRRRFVLLWCGSVVAVSALLTVGALALFGDGSRSNEQVDAGGTGTAPVYDSPPVDIDGTTQPDTARSGTGSTTPPTDVQTRNAEGGDATVTTPQVTRSPAALGPPRTHGVSLALNSKLSDVLRPGVERTLFVSVRNPNPFPVDLYRIDIRVDDAPVAGCLASWVNTGRYRYAGGTPRRIGPSSTVVVNLPIELVNLPDVDQNACQNTYFPLRLSGLAVDSA